MTDDLITAVERSKKGAVVTLNGEEKIFVSRALLIEREFAEGQALQRDELAQWLLPRQYPEALNLAVSLLAQRARSSGEIQKKLRDKFYLPETIEMVLYKLEKEHFLNDEAFAMEYAAALSRRQMGRTRIGQELRRKGVAPELIQQALEALDEEEAEDAALVLARKLLKRYEREPDPRKAMQKLLMAMARRGYGFEEARAAAERALQEPEECFFREKVLSILHIFSLCWFTSIFKTSQVFPVILVPSAFSIMNLLSVVTLEKNGRALRLSGSFTKGKSSELCVPMIILFSFSRR